MRIMQRLRLIGADLPMDRLQGSGYHEFAETCFDGRTPALWDI
jgi:hypothetical protein